MKTEEKAKRIVELEEELDRRVGRLIGRGFASYRFACTTCGERRINGPGITFDIQGGTATAGLTKRAIEELSLIVNELLDDVIGVKRVDKDTVTIYLRDRE